MAVSTLDAHAALVVIDLQNGLRDVPAAPHSVTDVIARTADLADTFRAHHLPVVLVRVTGDRTGSAPGGRFAPGRTEAGGSGRPARPAGWDEVVDDLAGHPEDVVVTKRNPGAFHGTDLDLHLRRRGVTQVVLTGIATTMGVEATARAAYDHGYHVVLAVDAMTDVDADSHHHSVARIFPRIGETATTSEIVELVVTTHG